MLSGKSGAIKTWIKQIRDKNYQISKEISTINDLMAVLTQLPQAECVSLLDYIFANFTSLQINKVFSDLDTFIAGIKNFNNYTVLRHLVVKICNNSQLNTNFFNNERYRYITKLRPFVYIIQDYQPALETTTQVPTTTSRETTSSSPTTTPNRTLPSTPVSQPVLSIATQWAHEEQLAAKIREVEALKLTIASKDKVISELTSSKDADKKAALVREQEMKESLRESDQALADMYHEHKEELNLSNRKQKEIQQVNDDLSKKLTSAMSTADDLRDDIQALKIELALEKKKSRAARQEMDTMLSEYREKLDTQQIGHLQTQELVKVLQQQLVSTKKEHDDIAAELSQTVKTLTESNRELEKERNTTRQLEKERHAAADTIKELEQKCKKTADDLIIAEFKLAQINHLVKGANQVTEAHLRGQSIEHQRRLTELQEQIHQLNMYIEELRLDNESQKSTLAASRMTQIAEQSTETDLQIINGKKPGVTINGNVTANRYMRAKNYSLFHQTQPDVSKSLPPTHSRELKRRFFALETAVLEVATTELAENNATSTTSTQNKRTKKTSSSTRRRTRRRR